MLRNYGYCVEKGYNADDYADAWARDLYNELLESAAESFWSDNLDVSDEFGHDIGVSEAAEAECLELCHDAYKEAYERYEAERETLLMEFDGDFEEHEVDDVLADVFNIITGNMGNQLNKLVEEKEKE